MPTTASISTRWSILTWPIAPSNKNSSTSTFRDRCRRRARGWPQPIKLLVFDFDGVLTDNRVLVFEDGREAVACNRGDGMGLSMLRATGMPIVVLSTEENPVVAARCRKLRLECRHGLADKRAALIELAQAKQVDLNHVVYVGNDVNDVGCMEEAGFAVAVADAHPSAASMPTSCFRTPAAREPCANCVT